MQIEIRSPDRLRGEKPLEIAPILCDLLEAARRGPLDLLRLRVVCDWVQYRQSFREPVVLREILPSAIEAARLAPGSPTGDYERRAYEIAVDLRRAASVDFSRALCEELAAPKPAAETGRLYLESWGPGSTSCIWAFNALYWKSLALWEAATGREYEQTLPGSESDALNVEAARALLAHLFRAWDHLAERRALPEDLYVLELGVGNGNQARVWLDEFHRMDQEHGRDYYRRLHYLMGDYSPHVLERARQRVAGHAERISGLVLDARRPTEAVRFLRNKIFLIYISNVYDNLPTDELVRLGGHLFCVEVRAYLPEAAAHEAATRLGVRRHELPDLVVRLLNLGPEVLAQGLPGVFPNGTADAVAFWRLTWEALRLEERYVPMEALDAYQLVPGVSGEVLRPIIEANGDVRMHVSNGAAESLNDSLPLLHPFGLLECRDLFVTDVEQYATGFRGPGKYDGSTINWVNGPVLAAVGRRAGFEIHFEPFSYRSGSNITIMTARVRE